eukprot:gb/GFBE01043682.1/.p1 GENE.gb/GFBE01043682.1/~~gb/GFBE01043682.1/.p1  ORF type:complete len:1139 (+),score=284.99 gb/GFBE01043682.1/:1-3417(+)
MQIGYVGGAVAGAAAGVQALFQYNQGNFKYDREMRQKTEFKTREWRSSQVGLWRDDVREIIGLTERKMDSYLMIGTLQLGMCVVLFCEGRLEPGTPPWLMHLYMLSTTGAFLYLLMAVWLAMHASIVAQCSAVRLLTQFIRLPIPSWAELQDMRTFAQTYEHLDTQQMMRFPFTGHAKAEDIPPKGAEGNAPFGAAFGSSKPSPTVGALPDKHAAERAIDPWLKEAHAHDRQGLYELMHMPVATRRHIHLARRASSQYQAFDAFTRTALSFGSHQLLSAVGYYVLGYCSIQDGAPWPAFCVAAIMVASSMTIAQLDFSMTRREQATARLLLMSGPLLSAVMAWARAVRLPCVDYLVLVCTPLASLAHASWLVFSLKVLGVEKQNNGAMLPMKFRAVLYLDVFGWFDGKKRGKAASPTPMSRNDMEYTSMHQFGKANQYSTAANPFEIVSPVPGADASSDEEMSLADLQEDIREQISLWRHEKVRPLLSNDEKARISEFIRRYEQATGESVDEMSQRDSPYGNAPWLKLQGYSDIGTEAKYLFQPHSGDVEHLPQDGDRGASGRPAAAADDDELDREDSRDVLSLSMAEEDVERFLARTREERRGRPKRGTDNEESAFQLGCVDDHFVRKTLDADKAGELRMSAGTDQHFGSDSEEDAEFAKEVKKKRLGHESYARPGRLSQNPRYAKLHGEPDEDVVLGYGDLKPGILPWQIFRGATLLMAALWLIGSCVPLALFPDMLVNNLHVVGPGGIETRLSRGIRRKRRQEQSSEDEFQNLAMLQGGELVNAIWPAHSGFEPRALTCDPFGKHIVVADDFGLYAGQVMEVVAAARQLRGAQGAEGELQQGGDAAQKEPTIGAKFVHQPHCAAIEGHGLQDVGLACAFNGAQSRDCRALVLHDHGLRLSECGLKLAPQGSPQVSQSYAQGARPSAAAASAADDDSSPSWDISSTWLHGEDTDGVPEFVNSLAVNSQCLQPPVDDGGAGDDAREFRPSSMPGCVVVGTSLGRIVELRPHYLSHSQLVPERAMKEWSTPVGQGSLHILPHGVVIGLHRQYGHSTTTVSAFDAELGADLGAWRLPMVGKMTWMNLCGGGESLFVLGRNRTDAEPRLYRFDMPEALKVWQAKRSQQSAEGTGPGYAEM